MNLYIGLYSYLLVSYVIPYTGYAEYTCVENVQVVSLMQGLTNVTCN